MYESSYFLMHLIQMKIKIQVSQVRHFDVKVSGISGLSRTYKVSVSVAKWNQNEEWHKRCQLAGGRPQRNSRLHLP